jgi:hypothetical protein
MNRVHVKIDPGRISVDPGEIRSLLGVPADIEDAHTMQVIHSGIGECRKRMSPTGGYSILKATGKGSKSGIFTEMGRFRTGRILCNMLTGAEYYAFFIVTAGPGPEALSANLFSQGKYLEGYAVDLIGSSLVDAVAEQVHNHISKEANRRGILTTNRYSPGYCGWDVREQQKLFSLFAGETFGVTLSASSLMHPIKSVSGVIGLGSSVAYRQYTCEICSMKNCHFRRGALN